MNRSLFVLVIGIAIGIAGMTFGNGHEEGESVKEISARDIREKLDGKDSKVTFVEVTLNPGQSGMPHRHPGPTARTLRRLHSRNSRASTSPASPS